MRIARYGLCFAISTAALFLTLAVGAQSRSGLLAKGREILETNCSRCHAIGRVGTSPNGLAPPFRSVVSRYAPEALRGALSMGLMSNHPDMPVFAFERDDVSAILGYLNSLSAEPGR